jgi:hypothetical protein
MAKEEAVYKDSLVEIRQKLFIDGAEILVQSDWDADTYTTSILPYRYFDSLLEVAKAVIDARKPE